MILFPLNVGITNNGSVSAYLETLKVFANNSEKYTQEIESFYASGDIKNATVKIHALKSTTRIIGATDLGELAQELEDAGKAEDRAVLKEKLPGLLERARKLGKDLAPLTSDSGDTDEDKQQISAEELEEAFAKIKESAEDCDDTVIEETLEMLSGYDLPDAEREKVDAIKAAFEDFDFDSIAELL